MKARGENVAQHPPRGSQSCVCCCGKVSLPFEVLRRLTFGLVDSGLGEPASMCFSEILLLADVSLF